jgi:site-specific DNA-methyltransferase (adenine-specific)
MQKIELKLGDCMDLMNEMPTETIDAIITDPPYGIDYQSARRTDKSKWKPKIANDKEPYLEWLPEAYRVTKMGGALICFCRWDVEQQFKDAIEDVGFVVKSQVIWDKEIHGTGDLFGAFAPQHENAWFAVKGSFKFWGNRPHSVIRAQRVHSESMIHPNEKPIKLLKSIITSVVPPDGNVLDPFSGSASTLAAALIAKRNVIGFEIDPKVYETAQLRLNKLKSEMGLEDRKLTPNVSIAPLFA